MTTHTLGLALELINGLGMSYEDVAELVSCHPSFLKRYDREYMCYKWKGKTITLKSRMNITDNGDNKEYQ